MTGAPLTVGVFLSGSGRTLANLIEHRDQHGLPIELALVISSSARVRGVEIARQAGIETLVVLRKHHPDPEHYSHAMFDPCRRRGIELVVMAGFLKHVLIPADFTGRVINIHPSLLPKFGGAGMYGHHVHQAVLDSGERVSGCTVHYVDNQYDNGPIILQHRCEVRDEDTADTLAARVFAAERRALPAAITQIASSLHSR